MSLITKDQLFASRGKRRFETYPIPNLGNVRLRSLTERERSAYEVETQKDNKGLQAAKRRLIVETVVDAEGNPLLNEQDLTALEEIDGKITGDIFNCSVEHCGFKKGEIEALVGNSGEAPAGSSP